MQELDLNQRPSGNEPDKLPNCSILQYIGYVSLYPWGSEFYIITHNERKHRHRFVLVHYWMFFLHPFLIKFNRIHFSISALFANDSGNFTY